MSRREENGELSSGQVEEVIKKAASLIDLLEYVEKSRVAILKKEADKEATEKEIILKLEAQRQNLIDISSSIGSSIGKYLQSKDEFSREFNNFKNYVKDNGSKISLAALYGRILKSDELKRAFNTNDLDFKKFEEETTNLFNEMEIEIIVEAKIFIKTNIHTEPIPFPEDLHPNNNVTAILKPRLKHVLSNLDRLGNAGIALVPISEHMKNFDSIDRLDVLATALVGGIRDYDTIVQKIKENGLGGIHGAAVKTAIWVIIAIVGALAWGIGELIVNRCGLGLMHGAICEFAKWLRLAGVILLAIGSVGIIRVSTRTSAPPPGGGGGGSGGSSYPIR